MTYTAMMRKTTTPTIATIVVVVPEEASLEAFNKASDWRAAAAAAWAAAAASRAFLRGVSRRGVRLDWNQTRSLKVLLKYSTHTRIVYYVQHRNNAKQQKRTMKQTCEVR